MRSKENEQSNPSIEITQGKYNVEETVTKISWTNEIVVKT